LPGLNGAINEAKLSFNKLLNGPTEPIAALALCHTLYICAPTAVVCNVYLIAIPEEDEILLRVEKARCDNTRKPPGTKRRDKHTLAQPLTDVVWDRRTPGVMCHLLTNAVIDCERKLSGPDQA
jgi:hypothetical protein